MRPIRHARTAIHAVTTAAALALFAAPAAVLAQDVGIDVGKRPDVVTIEDLDGNPVDLGRWMGKKPVIVEFWATWCPVCAALEPRLAAAKKRHGDAVDVLFVAVAVNQNKRSIERHLARHPDMPGPVLWDTSGRAVRAFQAPATGYVVILDATGTVRYTGAGEDQDIEAALAKIVR